MCACTSTECRNQTRNEFEKWSLTTIGREIDKQRGAWIDEVERDMRACRRGEKPGADATK